MSVFVCEICGYVSRRADCCDNPGCTANPSVSAAQKEAWRVERERRDAEQAERDRIAAIRRRMRGG